MKPLKCRECAARETKIAKMRRELLQAFDDNDWDHVLAVIYCFERSRITAADRRWAAAVVARAALGVKEAKP